MCAAKKLWGHPLSERHSHLSLVSLTLSFTILHLFGVYYRGIGPCVMFFLVLLLAISASVTFCLNLREAGSTDAKRFLARADLAIGIIAAIYVVITIGFVPGCPLLIYGFPLVTKLVLLVLCATACLLSFRHSPVFASLVAALAILCRAPLWFSQPLNPANSDMLPLISLACKRFLSGQNPYSRYFLPWELPLTYLPAAWMPFLSTYILGIDPRWLVIALGTAAGLVIYRAFPGAGAERSDGLRKLFLALMLLSSIDLRYGSITPEPVFWLALACFVFALSRNQELMASVAMGICLCTRQQAVLFLPFYAIYLFKQRDILHAARMLTVCLAIPLLMCLPYLLTSPSNFTDGIYARFEFFSLEKWVTERTWEKELSFAPFFYEHNLYRLLKPTIVLIQLALIVLSLKRLRRLRDLVCFMGLSLLSFLVFSPVIWPYMYIPLLLLLFAAHFSPRSPASAGPGGNTRLQDGQASPQ